MTNGLKRLGKETSYAYISECVGIVLPEHGRRRPF